MAQPNHSELCSIIAHLDNNSDKFEQENSILQLAERFVLRGHELYEKSPWCLLSVEVITANSRAATVTWTATGNLDSSYVDCVEIIVKERGDHDRAYKAPAIYTEAYGKGQVELSNIEGGQNYLVTVKFLKNVEHGNHSWNYIITQKDAKFRSVLSLGELRLLFEMADEYTSGKHRWQDIICLYRNKPLEYWTDIYLNHGAIMTPYLKDFNGDPGCPINGQIKGLFFAGRRDTKTSKLPQTSPFGKIRFVMPIDRLYDMSNNLYFTDFYCHNKVHYVTVVLTYDGSESDQFCAQHCIKLDPCNNPFFMLIVSQDGLPRYQMSKKVHVEVLYTEDIDVCFERDLYKLFPDLYHGCGLKEVETIFGGSSSAKGIKKNALCNVCNINRSKRKREVEEDDDDNKAKKQKVSNEQEVIRKVASNVSEKLEGTSSVVKECDQVISDTGVATQDCAKVESLMAINTGVASQDCAKVESLISINTGVFDRYCNYQTSPMERSHDTHNAIPSILTMDPTVVHPTAPTGSVGLSRTHINISDNPDATLSECVDNIDKQLIDSDDTLIPPSVMSLQPTHISHIVVSNKPETNDCQQIPVLKGITARKRMRNSTRTKRRSVANARRSLLLNTDKTNNEMECSDAKESTLPAATVNDERDPPSGKLESLDPELVARFMYTRLCCVACVATCEAQCQINSLQGKDNSGLQAMEKEIQILRAFQTMEPENLDQDILILKMDKAKNICNRISTLMKAENSPTSDAIQSALDHFQNTDATNKEIHLKCSQNKFEFKQSNSESSNNLKRQSNDVIIHPPKVMPGGKNDKHNYHTTSKTTSSTRNDNLKCQSYDVSILPHQDKSAGGNNNKPNFNISSKTSTPSPPTSISDPSRGSDYLHCNVTSEASNSVGVSNVISFESHPPYQLERDLSSKSLETYDPAFRSEDNRQIEQQPHSKLQSMDSTNAKVELDNLKPAIEASQDVVLTNGTKQTELPYFEKTGSELLDPAVPLLGRNGNCFMGRVSDLGSNTHFDEERELLIHPGAGSLQGPECDPQPSCSSYPFNKPEIRRRQPKPYTTLSEQLQVKYLNKPLHCFHHLQTTAEPSQHRTGSVDDGPAKDKISQSSKNISPTISLAHYKERNRTGYKKPNRTECKENKRTGYKEPNRTECKERNTTGYKKPSRTECNERNRTGYKKPSRAECNEHIRTGYKKPSRTECKERNRFKSVYKDSNRTNNKDIPLPVTAVKKSESMDNLRHTSRQEIADKLVKKPKPSGKLLSSCKDKHWNKDSDTFKRKEYYKRKYQRKPEIEKDRNVSDFNNEPMAKLVKSDVKESMDNIHHTRRQETVDKLVKKSEPSEKLLSSGKDKHMNKESYKLKKEEYYKRKHQRKPEIRKNHNDLNLNNEAMAKLVESDVQKKNDNIRHTSSQETADKLVKKSEPSGKLLSSGKDKHWNKESYKLKKEEYYKRKNQRKLEIEKDRNTLDVNNEAMAKLVKSDVQKKNDNIRHTNRQENADKLVKKSEPSGKLLFSGKDKHWNKESYKLKKEEYYKRKNQRKLEIEKNRNNSDLKNEPMAKLVKFNVKECMDNIPHTSRKESVDKLVKKSEPSEKLLFSGKDKHWNKESYKLKKEEYYKRKHQRKLEIENDHNVSELNNEPMAKLVKSDVKERKPELVSAAKKQELLSSERKPELLSSERKPELLSSERKPELISSERKPELLSSERKLELLSSERKLELFSTERKPELLSSERKPELLSSERKPELLSSERKPELLSSERKPELLSSESKPELLSSERKPELLSSERKPELLSSERKPELLSSERKPELLSSERKPELLSSERKPELLSSERKPESSGKLPSLGKGKNRNKHSDKLKELKEEEYNKRSHQRKQEIERDCNVLDLNCEPMAKLVDLKVAFKTKLGLSYKSNQKGNDYGEKETVTQKLDGQINKQSGINQRGPEIAANTELEPEHNVYSDIIAISDSDSELEEGEIPPSPPPVSVSDESSEKRTFDFWISKTSKSRKKDIPLRYRSKYRNSSGEDC